MRQTKLIDVTYYLPLSIPIAYIGMLFIYASDHYASYYGGLTRVPFDFYSLLGGTILSVVASGLIYLMSGQERKRLIQKHQGEMAALQRSLAECQEQLTQERQDQRELLAEFLATQKFERIFNSNLFEDLQAGRQIEKVEKLTGGYSGAQVYSFYRQGDNIPSVLKVDELKEINNEFEKFIDHVKGKLLIGPKIGYDYPWGSYGGLEYNLNWTVPGCDHLTFFKIYKECLYENTNPPIAVNTVQTIIEKLFRELQEAENWWRPDLVNIPGPINIYQEHYPFTRKIAEIDPLVKDYIIRGRAHLGLGEYIWDQLEDAIDTLLSIRVWNSRKSDRHHHRFNIVKARIHGDLNSRNILLDVDRRDHNKIHTIGLVDFSHAGNGLTKERAREFNVTQNLGHLATDFCRLEADVKFYLTDLRDEQELRRAWILENLLLKHQLRLPDWGELQANDEFGIILNLQGLSNESDWEELTGSSCWTEDKARKFVLVWRSVKAIRNALREILERELLQVGSLSMQPFYLAQLQASLSMIYYEDERFHNADLQKLYIVLASGLLCQELL